MLEIKDLHASINGKEILKGINLTVKPGEVHAIRKEYAFFCFGGKSCF